MVGNNRRDQPAVNGQTVHMTAKFSRGLFGFKKRVRGNSARKHHHLRIQKLQLTSKKGRAGRNFIVMRIAIVGRSAFEHIDNGHINGAFQTDRMKDVFKKLPAFTHKGFALKRPGASPTITILALGSAVPKTVESRLWLNALQAVH